MVRMFFIGETGATEKKGKAMPENFEYITDMMPFPDKHSSGYTNCPLCGSIGRVRVDEDGMVPIYEEILIPITE
jgi:hypothetical protein